MLLAFGMIVFGSATPISKLVGQAMPVFVGGLLRVLLGTALLGAAAWTNRDDLRRLDSADWLKVAGIAIFGMFGFSALMLYGMQLAPGAVGATVMSMTPAVTAMAAIVFFGERPTWRKLAAVGLALAGAVVLQLGHGLQGERGAGSVLIGAVLVFAAVCCESAYTLLGQSLSQAADPVLVAALGAALSIPLFGVGAALQWPGFRPEAVGARGWLALVWYGAGTLALGSWLWYRGIARVDGVTAAAFMGLMPLSALGLSYILLGEPFRWIHLIGFATVFAGVLLMSWEHARMAGSDRKNGGSVDPD
ncbi:MAG TPA: DMT family transporter [Caulobacteraceae bacterium]|nr:DMT family transporter [Caulobacteraceae bacterium]